MKEAWERPTGGGRARAALNTEPPWERALGLWNAARPELGWASRCFDCRRCAW